MLLRTKLNTPKPRDDTLLRPRLVELLHANLNKPLILLSAPAGYGKTTLLAQFTVDAPLPVGWYQLDAGDNDPAIFFEYLVECIANSYPKFGPTPRSLLQSIENIAAEWQRFLVVLINEIVETVPGDILLILEDYHLIENPLIHSFVDRLLAQVPPQLHMLISTRSDPLISLARLRARRQVAEVRGYHLQFTPEEVQTLFNEIANLDLPANNIQELVKETEGWAAALQLTLTSLMLHQGTSLQAFIENFRGTHRYLFDYLSEEVLAAQTPEVQSFLLSTSILTEMNPALCNVLLHIDNSRQILECLEAQNLFILPLDERREWYRYHSLFRDFLQERLQRQQGTEMPTLHLRAVTYFETVGDFDRAIDHCRAAGEVEKLVSLVEQAASSQLGRGRLQTVQRWLEVLPEELRADRLWLRLYQGMILATQGQPQEARLLLSHVRQAFAMAGDELGEGRALNQLCRVAFFEGHYEEALALNHEALRRMAWADHEGRSRAFREQAELWIYLGHSNRAIQAIEDSLAHARSLSDQAMLAERAIFQGVVYRITGRLSQAIRTMERGLAMLASPDTLGAHIAHSQLGVAYLERWRLEQAAEHFQQSLILSQKFQDSAFTAYAYAGLGIINTERHGFEQAQSHFDAALTLLEQTGLESLLAEATWHYLAELCLKMGRYTQAEAYSRQAIALRGDEPGGLAWGMGWLPLAKVYLVTGRPEQAEQILSDVAAASEKAGILLYSIESAFHLARLYLETGRAEEATVPIERALTAAAPQGHRWHFLSASDKAVPVLIHALVHKIEPAFVQALLSELGEPAVAALTELLSHPDPAVRRYAEEVLPSETNPAIQTVTITAPETTWQVTCFGDFRVTHNGQATGDPGWLATKAGELFAYFITFREGSIPRDRILEALWPEIAPEQSTGAFHTALYKLRQMLRPGKSQEKFIRSRSGEYFLEKEQFWIDADEFIRLNEECLKHPHQALAQCEACAARLQRAVELYQGDYLENLYYDWVLDEQRRLQEMFLNALQVLAQHYAHRGDYEGALAYGRQMLAKDPLREEVHRQMLGFYGQLGDRSGVIRQYRQLETILADELAIEPMPETQTLYQNLIHKVAA